jgi:hypothetical protein
MTPAVYATNGERHHPVRDDAARRSRSREEVFAPSCPGDTTVTSRCLRFYVALGDDEPIAVLGRSIRVSRSVRLQRSGCTSGDAGTPVVYREWPSIASGTDNSRAEAIQHGSEGEDGPEYGLISGLIDLATAYPVELRGDHFDARANGHRTLFPLTNTTLSMLTQEPIS